MEMLKLIKKAAVEAIEQSNPSDTIIGTVKTIDPLIINISQRLDIPSDFLLLTDNVRDHTVYTTYDRSQSTTRYQHLIPGEKVILQKAKGGQSYVVLNRVVKA